MKFRRPSRIALLAILLTALIGAGCAATASAKILPLQRAEDPLQSAVQRGRPRGRPQRDVLGVARLGPPEPVDRDPRATRDAESAACSSTPTTGGSATTGRWSPTTTGPAPTPTGRWGRTSATCTASSAPRSWPHRCASPEVPPQPPPQRPPDRQRGLHLPQRLRRGDAAQQAARLRLRGPDRRLADPAADDPLQAAGRDAGRQRRRQLPLVSPHLPGDPPGDALHFNGPRPAHRPRELAGELRAEPRRRHRVDVPDEPLVAADRRRRTPTSRPPPGSTRAA